MLWELAVGVVSLLGLLYFWLTWHYDYWKNNNVIYIKPSLVFGNLRDIILMRKPNSVVYDDFYWKYPEEPAIGLYKLRMPQLLIRDSSLVKTILIKEFNSFHDNDSQIDTDFDPILGSNPFFSTGEKWKVSRAIHTPALTTIKLKTMLPLMSAVCKDMIDYLNKNQDTPLEAKYFSGQFTTDVVASCVYGLSSNSFKDPNATFRRMSLRVFQPGIVSNLSFLATTVSPFLGKLLRLRFLPREVSDFFTGVIKDTIAYRKANGIKRNDFLQALMSENEKHDKPVYSDIQMVAFTMTFFFDGYETSSILISYILYMLACHEDVQDKLRKEVLQAIPDIENIDFEVLSTLPYLDAVVSETLRLYPPGTGLTKLCTKDIKLEKDGREYEMKEGQTVVLPIFSIHRDPKYFPNPTSFQPDRFLEKSGSVEGFFPFGLGPRACLGSRFALTQSKTAIVALISKFQISLKESPPKELEFDRLTFVLLVPKGGLWIKFKSLASN